MARMLAEVRNTGIEGDVRMAALDIVLEEDVAHSRASRED